jgi:iron complex transport system ATP-binding protein
VRFDDDDLDELSRRARAQRVAMIQQSTHTEVELTVRDAVALGRTPHLGAWGDDPSPAVVADALNAVEMSAFADRALTSLSGGERQRVAIGMALAQQPRLLLVDEPSNHLDVSAQLSIMSLLRHLADQGTTIVVALHDLTLALEHSDAAVVLSRGIRIAAGPTRETLTEQLISDVYGVEARILIDQRSGRRALSFAPRGTLDSSAQTERPIHAGSRPARPSS